MTLNLFRIESAESSSLPQLLIGSQKNPILRDTFTPLQGCG